MSPSIFIESIYLPIAGQDAVSVNAVCYLDVLALEPSLCSDDIFIIIYDIRCMKWKPIHLCHVAALRTSNICVSLRLLSAVDYALASACQFFDRETSDSSCHFLELKPSSLFSFCSMKCQC
jgi:hypothetical protein